MSKNPPSSSIIPGMTVGVTGASGLVGSVVCTALENAGYHVVRFSRAAPKASGAGLQKGPERRLFSLSSPMDCTGLDAVIHLAGESIHGIWTAAKKRAIYQSRILGTRSVVQGIRNAGSVKALINASAIGFYGFAEDGLFSESSPPGNGFLADVCRDWEAEASQAQSETTRVAMLRIGLVLGNGGALGMMTPIFRAGLGGCLGSGRQWMCAVHVRDIAGMCLHLFSRGDLAGPFNAVMPEPFTNREFTREIADVLHRPAIFPVPAFALRMALGGLSDLLLGSSRVVPDRFVKSEYDFLFPTLRVALEDVLRRKPN